MRGEVWARRREDAWGGGGASSARGGPNCEGCWQGPNVMVEGRARAERT